MSSQDLKDLKTWFYFDKKAMYMEKIQPLVNQLMDLAKEHEMSIVCITHAVRVDGGDRINDEVAVVSQINAATVSMKMVQCLEAVTDVGDLRQKVQLGEMVRNLAEKL